MVILRDFAAVDLCEIVSFPHNLGVLSVLYPKCLGPEVVLILDVFFDFGIF